MKPTYGRVSRWGLVAFASSLDQIGPFAHSVRDCALVLEAIAGHDPRDSTSIPQPAPALESALDGDVSGLVVGLPREYFELEGADPDDGIHVFINGSSGTGVRDIKLLFSSYGYSGCLFARDAEAVEDKDTAGARSRRIGSRRK